MHCVLYQVDITIELDADTWVLALEQTMLFLLIVGRWVMPSGEITRDQLSQLLFVYIGMASDIMELFYLFEEDAVIMKEEVTLIILTMYSVSLTQFTLVLTATKARKTMVTHPTQKQQQLSEPEAESECSCLCCETEIWSLLITVVLQDAPFLCMRLYVLVRYSVINYNILFFTAKNALVILLQVYRITVVLLEHRKKSKEEMQHSPKVHPHPVNTVSDEQLSTGKPSLRRHPSLHQRNGHIQSQPESSKKVTP